MKIASVCTVIIAVTLLLFPDISFATTEYATFDVFYQESSAIGWVVAGLFAVIAAGAIFFTGGTASPIVISIGTWIGGTMGLSGIAATNAGLALLGGGSIASGGFGIIGGVAVVTAALSFSTDVVFEYSVGKVMSKYNYSQLKNVSKNMITLPLPVNTSGSDSYEGAIDILEGIDKETPVSNNKNQQIIQHAIAKILDEKNPLDIEELMKNETLLSLLYFMSNDYKSAHKHAEAAIKYAHSAQLRRTLPAFIYATSSIYEEDFDFEGVTNNYFRYSTLAEPDNPLVPLIFSIYLDRLSLRSNDGYLDQIHVLNTMFMIMKSASLEDHYMEDYVILSSRYFIQLKLAQQKISSLATSSNNKLKNSPETVKVLNKAFATYSNLLEGENLVMNELLALSNSNDESRKKIVGFHALLIEYFNDKGRLESLIETFKKNQSKEKEFSWW